MVLRNESDGSLVPVSSSMEYLNSRLENLGISLDQNRSTIILSALIGSPPSSDQEIQWRQIFGDNTQKLIVLAYYMQAARWRIELEQLSSDQVLLWGDGDKESQEEYVNMVQSELALAEAKLAEVECVESVPTVQELDEILKAG